MRISDWSSDVCSSDLAGCREALFTLGDRPEARYAAAREALAAMGYESTLAYLGAMAKAVLDETGLLPHLNAGLMGDADYAALRPVSASMGLRSEEHTSELQSLMRISYAVFCLKKKTNRYIIQPTSNIFSIQTQH